jgi:hypothetical protein
MLSKQKYSTIILKKRNRKSKMKKKKCNKKMKRDKVSFQKRTLN